MVNPFMGVYAVQLGASSSDMGWYQSSTNLSNNLMQIIWGRLSDKTRQRIPFIIFGSLILSALWIPLMFVTNATQLIIVLAVQALLASMATPAWTALIGDCVPRLRLGRANASINLWAAVGSVVATLASGIIMVAAGGSVQQMFFVPLAIASVAGIASSAVMLVVKEKRSMERLDFKQNLMSDIKSIFAYAKNTPTFVKYCWTVGAFEFFMAISWPLFAITEIRILNASMLQIALQIVVQSAVTIVFQAWAGRLSDSGGRKPLLTFYRLGLVTVPLTYAFAPNMDTIIIVGVFWGFIQALGQASVTAYLLDIAPAEHRGSFAAIFNLAIGVATFLGSLVGGYLSDYATGVFGLIVGLQIVYVVSTVGRILGASLHFTLEETLKR